MKYTLNQVGFDINLRQKTISEKEKPFGHRDLINETEKWYANGYTPIPLSETFFKNVRAKTFEFVKQCVYDALAVDLKSLQTYHRQILSDKQHIKALQRIGKLIDPQILGIDVAALEKRVKKQCGINFELSCQNVCDIRIFRPYKGGAMDNNPVHRDTWLPALNNCVNVYLPIAGNNRFSSLSVIPGSHLWNNDEVERTVENAKIKGVQYGLPAVTAIKRNYKIFRPKLSNHEGLLFSSNIIHGGAVNLNKDTTRVSIEIRFWPKEIAEKYPLHLYR